MHVSGGLGNQLFQYAFLYTLAANSNGGGGEHPRYVPELEISFYHEHGVHRVCELQHLNISLPITETRPWWACGWSPQKMPGKVRRVLQKLTRPWCRLEKHYGPESGRYLPKLLTPPKRNTWFLGFFQTERYFTRYAEQLRREFTLTTPLTPQNEHMLRQIRSCTAIALHIRRTDYLTCPILAPVPMDYYERAMPMMETRLQGIQDAKYFIFSDDIAWARENVRPNLPHEYVDINDATCGYFDLELMKNCRHYIIPNSTFSWWGAWLNPDPHKIVIAPRRWFTDTKYEWGVSDEDMVPESWLIT